MIVWWGREGGGHSNNNRYLIHQIYQEFNYIYIYSHYWSYVILFHHGASGKTAYATLVPQFPFFLSFVLCNIKLSNLCNYYFFYLKLKIKSMSMSRAPYIYEEAVGGGHSNNNRYLSQMYQEFKTCTIYTNSISEFD